MTEPDKRFLSLGGGTQSSALALMSAIGELPRLDAVVFADTQGELPETYEYLEWLGGQLDAAEIPLRIITAGSLEEALLDPEYRKKNPTPPAHVLNPNGTSGRIGSYRCSYEYKRRIIDREIRRLCGGRGEWKKVTVEQWIGFSLDETSRCRQAEGCRCGHPRVSRPKGTKELLRVHTADGCTRCEKCTGFRPWQINVWPLIERRMKREDTIAWFSEHGFPTPPRSACWFCPNQANGRWQALRRDHPDLFARAVVLDQRIRNGGGFNKRGKEAFAGQLFLHRSLSPLGEADLRTEAQVTADSGQGALFDDAELGAECQAEVCFT